MGDRTGNETELKRVWDDRNKRYAILGTVLFHLVLAVLFYFFGLKTPVPPPKEKMVSIAMELGQNRAGSGNTEANVQETEEPSSEQAQNQPETTNETKTTEKVATQKEAPTSLKNAEEKKTKQKKEQEVDEEQSLVEKALEGNGKGGGGEGDDQVAGNEGDPEGQPKGRGTLGGWGEWKLSGRKIKKHSKPEKHKNEEGVVVLKIWVDRSGKVVRTSFNASKSTTTSQYLKDLAVDAAKRWKFNQEQDAAVEQVGEIAIDFTVE